MSILCCRIPDFLIHLTARTLAADATHPLALLGTDERVLAVSPLARRAGVRIQMTPREAQTRCPDLLLRMLDMEICRTEQARFVHALGRWELPVEAQGWGFAYLDMQDLARTDQDAQGLGAEMGRAVRAAMGDGLQPALGWDSGKFTARAAATLTPPGRMRLVGKAEETRFLSPLSIHLLPLPAATLQELHWLGIRTLGQYAALPSTAVWQRFGKAGREAQRWALGQDNRPVQATHQATGTSIEIDLDPPTARLPIVLDALMAALRPVLQEMQDSMEGCHGLHMTLHFLNGATLRVEHVFPEPVSRDERIREWVADRLSSLVWPAEIERITAQQPTRVELPVQQMTLLAQADPTPSTADEWLQTLVARYGPIFLAGQMINPQHPVDEQRFRLAAT